MYDPYNYDRSVGGEPEIIEERTSEVPMYQPIGPKTAASVLIRKRFRICIGRLLLAFDCYSVLKVNGPLDSLNPKCMVILVDRHFLSSGPNPLLSETVRFKSCWTIQFLA